jgi:hypothetical protein
MAPSATTPIVTPVSESDVTDRPEKHVHGAQDKSPLEAISHGPLVQPGMYMGRHAFASIVADRLCVSSYASVRT